MKINESESLTLVELNSQKFKHVQWVPSPRNDRRVPDDGNRHARKCDRHVDTPNRSSQLTIPLLKFD